MASKRRLGRFSMKEDRQLIAMAATGATVAEAAAKFRTSAETIERKTEKFGIQLKRSAAERTKVKGK